MPKCAQLPSDGAATAALVSLPLKCCAKLIFTLFSPHPASWPVHSGFSKNPLSSLILSKCLTSYRTVGFFDRKSEDGNLVIQRNVLLSPIKIPVTKEEELGGISEGCGRREAWRQ